MQASLSLQLRPAPAAQRAQRRSSRCGGVGGCDGAYQPAWGAGRREMAQRWRSHPPALQTQSAAPRAPHHPRPVRRRQGRWRGRRQRAWGWLRWGGTRGRAAAPGQPRRSLCPRTRLPSPLALQPFANMGGLMDNIKKAQQLVQASGAGGEGRAGSPPPLTLPPPPPPTTHPRHCHCHRLRPSGCRRSWRWPSLMATPRTRLCAW